MQEYSPKHYPSTLFTVVPKNWDCSIALHLFYLDNPDILVTLAHEVLHSVSVGLTPISFRNFRGYEEGVVERLTQLLYPQIAEVMGGSASIDSRNPFDDFLLCLEQLRGIARMDTLDFYMGLLQTPLAEREAVVVQWAKRQYVNESEARILVRVASALRKLREQR